MNQPDILSKWSHWVMRREGKHTLMPSDKRYGYVDTVLFSNDWPVARILPGPNPGTFVSLTRTGVHAIKLPDAQLPNLVGLAYVPCVGVFTNIPGDMLDIPETHQRVLRLHALQAAQFVDRVQDSTGRHLFEQMGTAQNKVPIYRADELSKDLDTIYTRHKQYRNLFALPDKPLPEQYRVMLADIIADRRKFYFSRKEKEKRDRTNARRQAKRALGV